MRNGGAARFVILSGEKRRMLEMAYLRVEGSKRREVEIMSMPEGLPASRFPVLNFPNMAHLTANDKDFSLALEMTIWESDVS